MNVISNDFTNVFNIPFYNRTLICFADEIMRGDFEKKMIVTPNVDHIVRLESDKYFRENYLQSDVFVNDSRILRLISRIIGTSSLNLIPGSDLTAYLFEQMLSSCEHPKIAIIGADVSVIEKIKEKYNLDNVVHHNPPMGFHESEIEVQKCVDLCFSANAKIIFLAVGSPKQEILAKRLRDNSVPGCYLCIGASLLFLAGEERRAPLFIQKMHCEWLFRLLQNPRRLARRYLIDGLRIIPISIREFLK